MPGYCGPRGQTAKYDWANVEPGAEVELQFDLPTDCTARDVEVTIKADHVAVRIMGSVIVDDDLLNRCNPDESSWEIRGTRLVVGLQKASGSKVPWPSVFLSDTKRGFDVDDLKNFF